MNKVKALVTLVKGFALFAAGFAIIGSALHPMVPDAQEGKPYNDTLPTWSDIVQTYEPELSKRCHIAPDPRNPWVYDVPTEAVVIDIDTSLVYRTSFDDAWFSAQNGEVWVLGLCTVG